MPKCTESQSRLIPKLLSLACPHNFWVPFLEGLHDERKATSPSADASDDVVKAILICVLHTIDPICLKPPKADPSRWSVPSKRRHQHVEYDSQPTVQLVRLCVVMDCPEALAIVCEKMQNYYGQSTSRRSALASRVYRPIVEMLISLTSSPYSVTLEAKAFVSSLEMIGNEVVGIQIDESQISEWKLLVKAAKWGRIEGVKALETRSVIFT